jgi:prefoldin subunit 5
VQQFYAAPNAAQPIEFLKNQASLLEGELAAIQKRIEELEKKENNV